MKETSLKKFAEILECVAAQELMIRGVSIDSRKVKSGDLFFALPGKKRMAIPILKRSQKKEPWPHLYKKSTKEKTLDSNC